MKQSNGFLAVISLTGFLILFIFATTVLDFGREKDVAEPSAKTMTPLESPTVDFADPVRGNREAKLTVVEFGNFMCSACADMDQSLRQLLTDYPDDIRLVWKDVAEDSALLGAVDTSIAARCASQQGAFWEYHDLLFAEQRDQLLAANLVPMAAELNLDLEDFQTCLNTRHTLPLIERNTEEALRLRLTAVPTLFIGERRIEGALSYDQLRAMAEIELNKLSAKSQKANEPEGATKTE